MNYLHDKNRHSLAGWMRRRAAHTLGQRLPDPRDQDGRDRGVELLWRARVINNERRRR
jgi:hypothetical protein